MQLALDVVTDFCNWSGMRINIEKSEITACDHALDSQPDTSKITVNGKPLKTLLYNLFFRYLGSRESLLGSPSANVEHVFELTKEYGQKCRNHPYTYPQAIRAVSMVQEAQFRYSAPTTAWSLLQLQDLYALWIRNIKAAWKLTPSNANAIFSLPTEAGGYEVKRPETIYIQALSSQIHRLLQTNGDIKLKARHAWYRLCLEYGTHKVEEMGPLLQNSRISCPVARLIRAAFKFGIGLVLPESLTGLLQDFRTWEGLRIQLTNLLPDDTPTPVKNFLLSFRDRTRIFRDRGVVNTDLLRCLNGRRLVPFGFLRGPQEEMLQSLLDLLPPEASTTSVSAVGTIGIQAFIPAAFQPQGTESPPAKEMLEDAFRYLCANIDRDWSAFSKRAQSLLIMEFPIMLFDKTPHPWLRDSNLQRKMCLDALTKHKREGFPIFSAMLTALIVSHVELLQSDSDYTEAIYSNLSKFQRRQQRITTMHTSAIWTIGANSLSIS